VITVAIVDDDKYVREGLAAQVSRVSADFAVTGTFGSVPELLADDPSRRAGVVLLDVRLGGGNRLDANIVALRGAKVNIVVMTVDTERPEIIPALRSHPVSIVHKNDLTDQMLETVVRLAADGGRFVTPDVQIRLAGEPMPRLTPRQEDVLRRIITGMPPVRVAHELHVTPGVVYDHLEEIERRFADAGYPIRDDADPSRNRAWNLGRKAIEIGYFVDPHAHD
jgi:DNA-binding NarL/FixJ family response regulator